MIIKKVVAGIVMISMLISSSFINVFADELDEEECINYYWFGCTSILDDGIGLYVDTEGITFQCDIQSDNYGYEVEKDGKLICSTDWEMMSFGGNSLYAYYGSSRMGATVVDDNLATGYYTITFYSSGEELYSASCVVINTSCSQPYFEGSSVGWYNYTFVDDYGITNYNNTSFISYRMSDYDNSTFVTYTVSRDNTQLPAGAFYAGSCSGSFDAYDYDNDRTINGCLIDGFYTVSYYYNNQYIGGDICRVNYSEEDVSLDSGLGDFCERLYTEALNRDFDPDGKEYWINALLSGTTGAEAARGFLFSDEVENARLSKTEFVNRVYKTLMNRTPSADEVKYWTGRLSNGASRLDVFNGFIDSVEWANICLTYGIDSGSETKPTIVVEASEAVKNFVRRMYICCLGREAEEAGVEYWAAELANRRISGSELAYMFFFSEEYVSNNCEYSEYYDAYYYDFGYFRTYIDRLYTTLIGRQAYTEEYNYWIGVSSDQLQWIYSQEYTAIIPLAENLFYGFAYSQEFSDICISYGIMR